MKTLNNKPIIQPSPDHAVLGFWGQIVRWIKQHGAFTRLGSLTAGLVVFFIFIPSSMLVASWDGLQSHPILAAMLLVFGLVAISLVWSAGQRLDAWIFLAFNIWGPHPLWLDHLMTGFTQVGNGFTTLAVALLLLFAGQRYLAYELILGTITLWLVVELIKVIAHRSRPFIRLAQTRIVGSRARGRSFPSGHTSQTFFIATLMIEHFHANLGVGILLYAIAFLVGITRMYVGAHYPRDVMAGAILGSAWGLLGAIFDAYILKGIG